MAVTGSDLLMIERAGGLHKATAAEIAALGGSGADPWTYVKLAAHATNSTLSPIDTDLRFTPPPNSVLIFEGTLMCRSAATTTGVRPGLKGPTAGATDYAGRVEIANTATGALIRFFGTTSNSSPATTGTPDTANSWFGSVAGMLVTGASVTGDVIVTLASEIDTSLVTLRANSWLRWRAI